MRHIVVACTVVFFLFSCSNKKVPREVLGIEKMQAVYWDYLRADVFANEYVRRDSSKNPSIESARLQQKVFDLHKVSKEKFYKSYEYYLGKPLLLKEMLDTMLVRQPKIHEKENARRRRRDSLKIFKME